TSAIYDGDLIDAAIGRTKNPSMVLTALQVSGAMAGLFFEHDLFRKPVSTLGSMSEGGLFRDHAPAGALIDAAGHDRQRHPCAATPARADAAHDPFYRRHHRARHWRAA